MNGRLSSKTYTMDLERGLDMGGAVIVTIGVAIVIILTELFGKGGKK